MAGNKQNVVGRLLGKPATRTGIISWNKDKKNPAKLLWESIVGAVVGIFKNKPEDRLATKIPISETFDQPSPDIWATIGNLLRNAFVRAIIPGLDREVQVQAGR